MLPTCRTQTSIPRHTSRPWTSDFRLQTRHEVGRGWNRAPVEQGCCTHALFGFSSPSCTPGPGAGPPLLKFSTPFGSCCSALAGPAPPKLHPSRSLVRRPRQLQHADTCVPTLSRARQVPYCTVSHLVTHCVLSLLHQSSNAQSFVQAPWSSGLTCCRPRPLTGPGSGLCCSPPLICSSRLGAALRSSEPRHCARPEALLYGRGV